MSNGRRFPRLQLCSFVLDLLNLCPHPLLESGFQFCLIIRRLQILDRLAGFVQSNEVTRNVLGAMLVGDEVDQLAVTAWMGPSRIGIVDAGQRVLKG